MPGEEPFSSFKVLLETGTTRGGREREEEDRRWAGRECGVRMSRYRVNGRLWKEVEWGRGDGREWSLEEWMEG